MARPARYTNGVAIHDSSPLFTVISLTTIKSTPQRTASMTFYNAPPSDSGGVTLYASNPNGHVQYNRSASLPRTACIDEMASATLSRSLNLASQPSDAVSLLGTSSSSSSVGGMVVTYIFRFFTHLHVCYDLLRPLQYSTVLLVSRPATAIKKSLPQQIVTRSHGIDE
ncbi:hypothetical protein IAQ61_005651 [Plenodomus lingam]|uniref:uncharacterized protein n=1 Tax=Leptosphaeria maculans TaxID=5022 RepID=UPI00332EDA7A|nr:hypothetical protein IAQ61_005651 [Plenodomus lingam]